MRPEDALVGVKIVHTIIWALFVACILAIPFLSYSGRLRAAFFFIAIVGCEVLIIAINHGNCPLTGIAARYTDNREDNFDIFLPLWLAKYNKLIFGTLFLVGVAYTLIKRLRSSRAG